MPLNLIYLLSQHVSVQNDLASQKKSQERVK